MERSCTGCVGVLVGVNGRNKEKFENDTLHLLHNYALNLSMMKYFSTELHK